MQISCAKEVLLEGLQTVLKTVSTKSVMPILTGIRLTGKNGEQVELASTDMELSLRLTLSGKVEGEGAAVIPGRLLTDIVRSLPPGDVNIEIRDNEGLAEVKSGGANFKINCLPAADFPRLPQMPAENVFQVAAAPLLATINTVARAASSDETRPVLTGILVKFNKDKLKMVATDSYRLSVRETKASSSLTEKKEIIIPRSSLEELARLGSGGDDEIKVGIVNGQVLFEVGATLLASRLIEGQFPNYQQLLPDESNYEIVLDKEELLEVTRRIGLMAQKNAPLRMKFSDGELTVSARAPQVGEASETLAVPFKGEETEIGFNAEFFRDGIDSVDEERLILRIISPLKPGLIKGSSDDFLYLVMPVRL